MTAIDNGGSTKPPALDIIDYLAKAYSVEEREVQALLVSPRLRAAVAAYGQGLIPLGYAVCFSWDEAKHQLPILTPNRLADLIRYVSSRRKLLEPSDHRHIAISRDWASTAFPDLFDRKDYKAWENSIDEKERTDKEFMLSDPLSKNYEGAIDHKQRNDYAEYWVKNSSDRIRSLLSDRRFLAGFDAFQKGRVSQGGMIENVFGDGDHVLFPELGWNMSALVLNQLANAVTRGEVLIPDGLNKEFPEFYDYYQPEAFGLRIRSKRPPDEGGHA